MWGNETNRRLASKIRLLPAFGTGNNYNSNTPTYDVGNGSPNGGDWRNEVLEIMWGFAQGFGSGERIWEGEYMPDFDEKHFRRIDGRLLRGGCTR